MVYIRIAYDEYCWSIIHFAHALIQIAAALSAYVVISHYANKRSNFCVK